MIELPDQDKLPEKPFVSLAEALTWLAFGEALSLADLRAQVEGHRPESTESNQSRLKRFFANADNTVPDFPGLGQFEDRQSGLAGLSKAWGKLRQAVERETLRMRARYSPVYNQSDASVADKVGLTGEVLATFSQFDISTGGIRRQPESSPDVLWRDHPASFGREFASFADDPRAADGYLLVEVERAGLRDLNFANQISRAPSVKRGQPPSDDSILKKADEMKSRNLHGRDIAKTMRFEPGFENVATTRVRELVKGRWKPGGRPSQDGK